MRHRKQSPPSPVSPVAENDKVTSWQGDNVPESPPGHPVTLSPPYPPRPPRAAPWLICLGLAFTTFWAYSGLCDKDVEFLQLDDGDYVGENAKVNAGLTLESAWWALTTFHVANWHPVTWLSLQLDYELYSMKDGLKAWGFHLTNVLLHIANAVLLFLVLERMTQAMWPSAFVAGFFALHPLHVESVAWVAERKDVLSGFFWLLTMAAYFWYTQRPSAGRYLLVALAFALGLMAKPMAVTLPFVLLLLDYWPLDRLRISGFGIRVLEKLPLFAMSVGASILTVLAQGVGHEVILAPLPLHLRIVNAGLAYAGYLRKTFWPSDLAPMYTRPHDKLPVASGITGLVAIAAVTLLLLWWALRLRKQDKLSRGVQPSPCHPFTLSPCPPLLVGWLWFIGTLVPVIGLVQVGRQTMADRYTYVPHIGLFIALVWGLYLAVRSQALRFVLAIAGSGALAACFVLTEQQADLWPDGLKIWQHAVAVTEDNFGAYENLGLALMTRNRPEDGKRAFRAGLAIEANYAMLHYDLGRALKEEKNWSEAAASFAEAARLAPHLSAALEQQALCLMEDGRNADAVVPLTVLVADYPNDADWRYALATALQLCGRTAEATREANESLRLALEAKQSLRTRQTAKATDERETQTSVRNIYRLLGSLAAEEGKLAEAETHFRAAIREDYSEKTSVFYLAWCRGAQGKEVEARKLYDEALQRFLRWPEDHGRLTWLLATHPDPQRRNGRYAVLRALVVNDARDGQDTAALDILAAAYAELGSFEKAIAAAEKAVAAAPPARKEAIKKRLELYKKGEPYRESQR